MGGFVCRLNRLIGIVRYLMLWLLGLVRFTGCDRSVPWEPVMLMVGVMSWVRIH
jgi:hypothetical protein